MVIDNDYVIEYHITSLDYYIVIILLLFAYSITYSGALPVYTVPSLKGALNW